MSPAQPPELGPPRFRSPWMHLPSTGLARSAFLLALLAGLIWLARQVPRADGLLLTSMQLLVGFALVVLAIPLAWRLVRTRLLWSLRSKLILTYLLIGLAPVVLFVTLTAISAYIAAGQFSIHLADTRMRQEVTEIATDNAIRTSRIARFASSTRRPGPPPGRQPGARPQLPQPVASTQAATPFDALRQRLHRQTSVYLNGAPFLQGADLPGVAPTDQPNQQAATANPQPATANSVPTPLGLPVWATDLPRHEFRGVILDGTDLYLVAINQSHLDDGSILSVVTSLPVDGALLDVMAQGLGRIHMAGVMTGNTAPPPNPNRPPDGRTPNRTPVPANDPAVQSARDKEAAAALNARSTLISRNLQRSSVYGGTEPPPVNFADIPVSFPSTEPITDWDTGDRDNAPIQVDSRPSLLYRQLFGGSLGGIVTSFIRTGLIVLSIVFAFIEALALFAAIRLSRTITASVTDLYAATQRVDRGDLHHRIPAAATNQPDQLGELALSFNRMTGSLERLLEEQKEKERLQSELSIAQEVQANLFPSRARDLPTLELHGVCRPARSVSGDYYDFLVFHHTTDGEHVNGTSHSAGHEAGVGIAIGDISGKGISAALLMATLHSAVRAYRFASEDLVFSERSFLALASGSDPTPTDTEQRTADRAHSSRTNALPGDSGKLFESPGRILALLNRHLFRSTQPEKYATLFLAHYEAATAQLTYSNAGQLPPLVLGRDGKIRRLEAGGTVVGLMDNMTYEEGRIQMHSGDILVAYSDGVTEPENDFGDFGETRLMEVVARYRDHPLHVISAQVMQALDAWIGAEEQPDDITLVLARQI